MKITLNIIILLSSLALGRTCAGFRVLAMNFQQRLYLRGFYFMHTRYIRFGGNLCVCSFVDERSTVEASFFCGRIGFLFA